MIVVFCFGEFLFGCWFCLLYKGGGHMDVRLWSPRLEMDMKPGSSRARVKHDKNSAPNT